MWQAIAAICAAIGLILKRLFDKSDEIQKKKEDAAEKASRKIFM